MNRILTICILILVVLYSSCSSKSEIFPELELEKDICAIAVGEYFTMEVVGSGDYSIDIKDLDIVSCELQNNAVTILGEKLGETNINIKDNKSLDEKSIRVKIISDHEYVSLIVLDRAVKVTPNNDGVSKAIQNNCMLANGNIVTLMHKQNKIYIFEDEEHLAEGNFSKKGTYSLRKTEEPDHGEIEFKIDGNAYLFSLDPQSHMYLTPPKVKSAPPPLVHMYRNVTNLYTDKIPELESASVEYRTICRWRDEVEIPMELLFEN